MFFGWLFAVYLLERLFELWLAKKNFARLAAQGGREYHSQSYRTILVMHLLFWVCLMTEAWPWIIPVDILTMACLVTLALLMLLRYWCIVTLGPFWNTRIVVVPGAGPIRRGPYRWLRHPNYLVVSLEFALIPLLMRAPATLFLFALANLVVLRQRIALEEAALADASAG